MDNHNHARDTEDRIGILLDVVKENHRLLIALSRRFLEAPPQAPQADPWKTVVEWPPGAATTAPASCPCEGCMKTTNGKRTE